MFRVVMSPSSGDKTVFMRHLLLVILCGCLSVWYAGLYAPAYQSSTQNNKCQVSHKHSCSSWWWTRSRPKHVETDKYNYTKKNCSPLVYLQGNNHFKQQTPFPKKNILPGIPVLVSVLTDDITTLNQQTLQYQIEGIFPRGEKIFITSLP